MRILYLSDAVIPSATASSLHIMKMCQAFSDNGHEVTLLSRANRRHSEEEMGEIFQLYGVKRCFSIEEIICVEVKKLRALQYSYKAKAQVKERKPDLVYGRDLNGAYLAARSGLQTIYEAHQPFFEESAFKAYLLHRLLRSENVALVVISNALRVAFEEGGYDATKIKVVHDAADWPSDAEPVVVLPGGACSLKVGYVGSLYEGKGVEIVEKIAPRLPDSDFHIVGGSAAEVATWKARMPWDNVFFHGYVPPKNVSRYIEALDICLLPNQRVVRSYGGANIAEFTSPLKLFEYMSHRKAIIASDLTVLREVLNESNALLVDPEDADEWVAAVKKLMQDRDLAERLRTNAYQEFRSKYTWQRRAMEVLCT